MADVFKAGGLPLTLLFVAALVMVGLMAKGVVSQALGFFQTVTVILTISSVVTLLALAGIAYARWRAELDVRRDVYRSETELQDKFILGLTQNVLAMAKPGWAPSDLEKILGAISNSMVGLIQGVSTAREDLRKGAIVPTQSAEQGSNSQLEKKQAAAAGGAN